MKERKRSLSQTGGRCRLTGDPAKAELLAGAMRVDPKAKLPLTHGFHAYPARMHPETAGRVLAAFPEGPVLDPFCGSGTVALEALRAGRPFTGLDVNGVALEVAWVRTRVLIPDRCRAIEREGHRIVEEAFAENEKEDFKFPAWAMAEREWYDAHTLREVCILKQLIETREEFLRRALLCVLSSIAVKLSKQISDSDPKMDLFHRPRGRHSAFRWFGDKASELTKGLLLLSSDLYKRKIPVVEPVLRREDARTMKPPEPRPGLILTSPPYAGTYTYVFHHARRFPLFGADSGYALAREIGQRKRGGEGYVGDLQAALKAMLAACPRVVLLIGDGQVHDRPLKALDLVTSLAPPLGAQAVAAASQHRRNWDDDSFYEEHLILVEGANHESRITNHGV